MDAYTSTRQDSKPFCIDFDAPYAESTAFAPPPSRSTCGRRNRAVSDIKAAHIFVTIGLSCSSSSVHSLLMGFFFDHRL